MVCQQIPMTVTHHIYIWVNGYWDFIYHFSYIEQRNKKVWDKIIMQLIFIPIVEIMQLPSILRMRDRLTRYRSMTVYYCRKDKKGLWYDKEAIKITSKALGHNRISVIAEHYLNNSLLIK